MKCIVELTIILDMLLQTSLPISHVTADNTNDEYAVPHNTNKQNTTKQINTTDNNTSDGSQDMVSYWT